MAVPTMPFAPLVHTETGSPELLCIEIG